MIQTLHTLTLKPKSWKNGVSNLAMSFWKNQVVGRNNPLVGSSSLTRPKAFFRSATSPRRFGFVTPRAWTLGFFTSFCIGHMSRASREGCRATRQVFETLMVMPTKQSKSNIPRSPNNNASSPSSTKPLAASPPPRPMPRRTGRMRRSFLRAILTQHCPETVLVIARQRWVRRLTYFLVTPSQAAVTPSLLVMYGFFGATTSCRVISDGRKRRVGLQKTVRHIQDSLCRRGTWSLRWTVRGSRPV